MSVHGKVQAALRQGTLQRPARCQDCDRRVPLVAHHDDYSKPLEIRWLCRSCHRSWHAQFGAGLNATGVAPVSIRLPESMHDRLRESAEANERTVSQEARLAISRHVEAESAKAAA